MRITGWLQAVAGATFPSIKTLCTSTNDCAADYHENAGELQTQVSEAHVQEGQELVAANHLRPGHGGAQSWRVPEALGAHTSHGQGVGEGSWSSPHALHVTGNCAVDPPPSPAALQHHHRQTEVAAPPRCADTQAPGACDHCEPELRFLIAGEEHPAAQPDRPSITAAPTQPTGG